MSLKTTSECLVYITETGWLKKCKLRWLQSIWSKGYRTLQLKKTTTEAEFSRTLFSPNMFVTSVVGLFVGLAIYMRSHDSKQSNADFRQAFLQQPTDNLYLLHDKVCGFTTGLRSHMRVHGGNVNGKDSNLVCHICHRARKDGWRSHVHSHRYF